MGNAIWQFITDGLLPLINVINNLGTSTLGWFGFEIGIFVISILFAMSIKKSMNLGMIGWIIATLIIYGFLQSLGLRGVV